MVRAHSLALFSALLAPALVAQQLPPPLTPGSQQLSAENSLGTDPALRAQLLTMLGQDQTARGLGAGQHSTAAPAVASNLAAIDAVLTKQLKDIVAAHTWPTIALVGVDGSNAATTLLGHTADYAWRRSLLPQLESLADQRRIDPAQLAIVIDKQLVADGKPQRYGTQFKMVDGEMAMISVEDPGGLDALRTRALLPPMDTYKQTLSRMYHLQVSKKIASPPAPSNAAQ